jgi:hypothetical protein
MKYLSAVTMLAVGLVAAGLCGCGGSDEPITWAAQNMGYDSTITFNADGTVEVFVTHPEDQDDPEHQTGTWYTRGNTLYLTDAVTGKVTEMGYELSADGNSFVVTEGMSVTWARVL